MLDHCPLTKPAKGLRKIATASGRGALTLLLGVFCTGVLAVRTAAQVGAPAADTPLELTVSFVSEVPWPADAGAANPLERWARMLSSEWSAPANESSARVNNLKPELSWERLAKTARTNKADIFMVHGYEYLEGGAAAKIEALLTPALEGKAAMTEFVILSRRGMLRAGEKFSWMDLAGKQILVDRGGCGELVYRWLEVDILLATGIKRQPNYAMNFADFRSAFSTAEAILSVYFGEADACIVSRDSYSSVLLTNPAGLADKMTELTHSPRFLQHIVACRSATALDLRKKIIKSTAGLHLEHNGTWGLIPLAANDLTSLRAVTGQWQEFFEEKAESIPSPPSERTPVGRPSTAAAERRAP